MATLQQLRDMAVRRLRDQGFTALQDDQDYTDAVNDAQNLLAEICKNIITATATSTVAGVGSYELSDRFLAVYPSERAVVYTDGNNTSYLLQEMSYDFYVTLESKIGIPKYYLVNNDAITIYPTPDYTGTGNLLVNNFLYPVQLVNLTDECDYHDKYNPVISYFAAAYLCEWMEAYDQQKKMMDAGMLRLNTLTSISGVHYNKENYQTIRYFGS